jgi:hypothetical protein
MNYIILTDGNHGGSICIDKEQGKIKKLNYGHFEEVTKQCERRAKSKTKQDTMGAFWFNALKGDESGLRWYKVFKTDDKGEYFDQLTEIQIQQAESYAKTVKHGNNWNIPHVLGY